MMTHTLFSNYHFNIRSRQNATEKELQLVNLVGYHGNTQLYILGFIKLNSVWNFINTCSVGNIRSQYKRSIRSCWCNSSDVLGHCNAFIILLQGLFAIKFQLKQFVQIGPEPKTSLKKRINLSVVVFGIGFAIFSITLIVYGWFEHEQDHIGCSIMMSSLSNQNTLYCFRINVRLCKLFLTVQIQNILTLFDHQFNHQCSEQQNMSHTVLVILYSQGQ